MGLGRQDFSGKKLSPQEADAVIADLKKYLLDHSRSLADQRSFP